MLTVAPHLLVRRPSPTTAEFTVTTRPPPTLASRLLLLAVLLARLLLALAVLLLLYSAWTLSPFARPDVAAAAQAAAGRGGNSSSSFPSGSTDAPGAGHEGPAARPPSLLSSAFVWYALRAAHASPAGQALHRLAARLPAPALLPGCAGALWLAARRVHATESLLVLRGLGIQTGSSGATYLGRGGRARFIPAEKIRDVLINEAFRGFEVRHYLVVVVDGEEDLVVVFPRLLPRRAVVEAVWRGARRCLYDPDGVKKVVDEKG